LHPKGEARITSRPESEERGLIGSHNPPGQKRPQPTHRVMNKKGCLKYLLEGLGNFLPASPALKKKPGRGALVLWCQNQKGSREEGGKQ